MNEIRKATDEIVKELSSAAKEGTESPYWLILDPPQNMKRDVDAMAGGIFGPFFSRKSAEAFFQRTRYNFSKYAHVYCCSGYASEQYKGLRGAMDRAAHANRRD